MQDLFNNLIENKQITVVDDNEEYKKFLREAYLFAEENSTDETTWVGAVITKGNKVISKGANRFAPGVIETEEREERPKKYMCQDHAERNAIYIAAREGKELKGSTIFTPWIPCPACSSGIITSGIKTLVVHYERIMKTSPDWLDDFQESLKMLSEGGVEIIVVRGKIGGCRDKVRNEIWEP